ncbi:Adenylate cyclase [Desulfovibrio sp. TomC]|nr:Adenylate cyclase [Desulfovibrio sp. TomC]
MAAAVFGLLLLLSGYGCVRKDSPMPIARDGVFDLSGWDMARDGPVSLSGQWQYYWDRLLTPDDFAPDAPPPQPSGFMALPHTWKGVLLHGRPLPGRGQATLRLRLAPGPGERRLEMRLFGIHAAYRLWADGKLLAASGVAGTSAATESAHRSLVLVILESHGAPIDLVLQVSNHTFRRGGVLNPIGLGLPGQLEQAHIRTWAWAMFFAGSLLIMASYHFVLYSLRKKEVSTLYFGLGCILFIGIYSTMDSSDWLITLFVPKADPEILAQICLVGFSVLGSVLYRFYWSLYPKEFIPCIQYICDIRSIVFVCIILTQPQPVIYDALPWLAVTAFALNACFLVMLLLCLRHRRSGASVLLIGYFILSATSLNDIYGHVFSLNGENLMPFGLLAFVISQALAMAQRFSNAFTAVENLSAVLQTEMDERSRLEWEIVNVSEEERRRLSHDLHDGLCQQLAGTRLRCSALARRPIAEPNVAAEVSEIAALLQDSVSQAYNLSRGLWPVEHDSGDVGASLAELARRMGVSSGVEITYGEDLACAPCHSEQLVQLFRIAQEAVTNAVKHANPGRISVSLRCGPDQRLTLAVCDDGIGRLGAAPATGGLGLRIMAHRARMIGATLTIDDAAGGGTSVTCSLSCAAVKTTQEDADG